MSDQDQLTPAERELETALRTLRPVPARINPTAVRARLRRSVAEQGRIWRFASAAAAAAAIAAGVWLTRELQEERPGREDNEAAVVDVPIDPRMLIVYRRALARSPAELEAVLDRQASGLFTDGRPTPLAGSALWNSDFHPALGEM